MIDCPESHDYGDQKLHEIENRLSEIYRTALIKIEEKSRKLFEEFKKSDEKMIEMVKSGRITQKEYTEWRKDRLLVGEQFKRIRDSIVKELAKTNETALAYVNGELPEVFAVNYNDMGAAVINAAKNAGYPGVRFDIVDADTVRLLAMQDSKLLPYKKLDIPADKRWNKKKMQSELLQGILLGEPVPEIASRLEKITDMNRASAMRNARTMITGAENSGRLAATRRLEESGVVLKRVWISAHDKVVRELHRSLDGQERGVEEPFSTDGYTIMYPGDPAAAPVMVYNCRCTTGVIYLGYKKK